MTTRKKLPVPYQLYHRGDIWFVRETDQMTNAKLEGGSRIMAKSRPYVLIDCNEALQDWGGTVMAMPLTTKVNEEHGVLDDVNTYGDIILVRSDGQLSRIVTSQPMPVDTKFIGNYIGRVPDEVMVEIDRQLSRRLGYGRDTIADASLYTEVVEMQIIPSRTLQPPHIARRLEEAAPVPAIPAPTVEPATPIPAPVHVPKAPVVREPAKTYRKAAHRTTRKNVPEKKNPTQRIRWTAPVMADFIREYESTEDKRTICRKWGCADVQSLTSKYYYVLDKATSPDGRYN